MKMLRLAAIFTFTSLIGCGTDKARPAPQPIDPSKLSTSIRDKAEEAAPTPVCNPSGKFKVDFGGMSFSATTDDFGNITILDYPSEWQGKAKVVRYYGHAPEVPFSDKHCQMIRAIASNPDAQVLVRGGHRIVIVFEIPAFLSPDFWDAALRSAMNAGYNFQNIYIKNSVNEVYAQLELSFADNAISRHIGHIDYLLDQLHVSRGAKVIDSFHHEIIVDSVDVICDLISQDAKLTMIYPIDEDGRTIRVTYGPLEVKIPPSSSQ